jgi:sRNA-binding protein
MSVAGNKRIDLDGREVGTVTELEAAEAQERVKYIRATMKERQGFANGYGPAQVMRNMVSAGQIPPEAMRKVATPSPAIMAAAKQDEQRQNASPAELLAAAQRKLVRAASLFESEDDEFKATFIFKVLLEAKADIDAVMARV